MSRARPDLAVRLLADPAPPASEVDRVWELLDRDLLARLGWDDEARILRPPASFGQLTSVPCPIDGCVNVMLPSACLCGPCADAFKKSDTEDLAEFASRGLQRERFASQRLCLVCRTPGHERPARGQGLCAGCASRAFYRGQSAAQLVAGDSRFPPCEPRPSFGKCMVVTCSLWADGGRPRFCNAHRLRWIDAGKPDIDKFAASTGPKVGTQQRWVCLLGLNELVVAELLFWAQCTIGSGQLLRTATLRTLAQIMRDCGAETVRDLDRSSLPNHIRRSVDRVVDELSLSSLTVESQRGKDTLDLRAWGMSGILSFVGTQKPLNNKGVPNLPITQRWLRDAIEAWTFDQLARLRTPAAPRATLKVAGIWSSCLARRPDRGEDPAALGREDVTGLLEYLGMLARTGHISETSRSRQVEKFGLFLRGARSLGLTDGGRCLAGLPASVSLRAGDVPKRPVVDPEDEIGEALPDAVVAQILGFFDGSRPAAETRIRLALGTGRRPSELCELPLVGCLDYDSAIDEATGECRRAPVLVFDMPKVGRTRCRLPLSDGDAELIRAQQTRVHARYPETDESELPLFPRPHSNFRGTEPFNSQRWAGEIKRWVTPLDLFDGVLVGDQLVVSRDSQGNPIRYPWSKVHCYSFRHTYAQRHIDRGTNLEVLCELLGHSSIETTRGYYRIKAAAKRQATDRMLPFQVAVSGPLRLVDDVSESHRLRHGVGRISVLMGWCEEPSNVKAEGTACPMRHRCFGCVHFRTDPSFLIDLRRYLVTLLADKERLAAAVPGLAEWARTDAIPSDGEIAVVRRLIADCEARLVGLDPVEHSEVLEAMDLLARTRTALDDVFPMSEQGQVGQSVPVAFPRVAAGR